MRKLALTAIVIGLVTAAAYAREYSPRVVSPHNADAYSMKTFAQFDRWRELHGDALAWEVYRYLADKRTGVFHCNEVFETGDSLSEYTNVRDPVKIINVYGYAYCAILGPVMAGICQDMGIGPSRTLALPGWGHVAAETFYDGKWHYLDIDVRAVFRRDDGTLASMADAQHDPSLWKGRGPLFFPEDPLDLTPQVAGSYGYLLRIKLQGEPKQATVRSLALTTWVQVAPAALPSLRKGENRMEYRTGDHYGQKTRVVEVRSQANEPAGLLKYLAEPPGDYDPSRKTARIRRPAVAQVPAPPGTRIAWFTAQGSFNTHQREAARNTRNTIAYAVDRPQDFQELYRADVPTDTEHWHCNAYREVRLARPAERVYVRYVGDPGLNNFHVYAHCLDQQRPSRTPVVITHAWKENGQPKSQSVTLSRPGPYTVVAAQEPTDESIEISLPSDAGK